APMLLRWKIHDSNTRWIMIEIRFTETHFTTRTTCEIVFEHRRETLTESHRYAFAHHAYAIHCVHERLRLAGKKIPDQRLKHKNHPLLYRKNNTGSISMRSPKPSSVNRFAAAWSTAKAPTKKRGSTT